VGVLDVVGEGHVEPFHGAPLAGVEELTLPRTPVRLDHYIVVAISNGSHAHAEPSVRLISRKCPRRKLRPVVGVHDGRRGEEVTASGHLDGRVHQRSVSSPTDRPTHDSTGVGIQDHTCVDARFGGGVFSDVGDL